VVEITGKKTGLGSSLPQEAVVLKFLEKNYQLRRKNECLVLVKRGSDFSLRIWPLTHGKWK